jgi:dipeptide transport system permease protein
MFGFLLRRIGLIIPTFLGITLLVFSLIHMIPGDAVEAMSGERGMDPARYARLLHEFGLDRPLYVQ